MDTNFPCFHFFFQRVAVRPSPPPPSPSADIITDIAKLAKKVNGLGLRALNMYRRLVDSFRVPADQREPDLYEEEWLPHVLVRS